MSRGALAHDVDANGCGAALASQSLAIMISLIPYIRETFRRHLSQKQAVMLIEFDKLKRVRAHHVPSNAIADPFR